MTEKKPHASRNAPTEKPFDKPEDDCRGLVIVNIGKGNSTAAFGLAARAEKMSMGCIFTVEPLQLPPDSVFQTRWGTQSAGLFDSVVSPVQNRENKPP